MQTTRVVFCLLATTPLLSGCGTALNLANERTVYGGAVFDVGCGYGCAASLVQPGESPHKFPPGVRLLMALGAVADFPFSLVGDTLTLPLTAAAALEASRVDSQPGQTSARTDGGSADAHSSCLSQTTSAMLNSH
jgi:uncharacterized protein YceK